MIFVLVYALFGAILFRPLRVFLPKMYQTVLLLINVGRHLKKLFELFADLAYLHDDLKIQLFGIEALAST